MIEFVIKLDPVDIGDITRKLPKETEAALNEARDKILDTIELIQIHKYTSSAFPPRRRYQRTFRLRRSSRIRATGTKLPHIGGIWWADEDVAPYARDVIGPKSRQAAIHRGRWKSLEEIAEEADQIAPQLIEEELNAIRF